jgi:O-acetyl-ADP-ribose deacetylase (regulator of RNase III)
MAPKTKDSHPGKATLPNINHSLRNLVKELNENDQITSLAITKISTGVGGQDWKDVKPLLEQHLSDLKIPVYVYETFQKDKTAEEK